MPRLALQVGQNKRDNLGAKTDDALVGRVRGNGRGRGQVARVLLPLGSEFGEQRFELFRGATSVVMEGLLASILLQKNDTGKTMLARPVTL